MRSKPQQRGGNKLLHPAVTPAGRVVKHRGIRRAEVLHQGRKVRLASVIRVDKAEVKRLAALINIRHAGRRQLDRRLAEAVHQPGANKGLHRLAEIVQEQGVVRRKQVPRVAQHHALIALVAVNPVGALFRLAQRFFEEAEEPRFECFKPFSVVR